MSTLAAGRTPQALARFLAAFVLLLAADLLIKTESFHRVAGEPVVIERDADGDMIPLPPHEPITVVPKGLALHLTVNHGAVFGLGQGMRWVFVAFSLVAVAVVGTIFARSRPGRWILHLALASVLAGALGNLYDRLVHGGVRDMFLLFPGVDLPFGLAWPGGARGLYPWIFNFADVCLVVGLLVLVVITYREDAPENDSKPETSTA